jgi:hypothetical protein
MKVDITQVGAIHQDFTNKRIRVLSKRNFCMWENTYQSEEAFNKAFNAIYKKFSAELARREKELNKV